MKKLGFSLAETLITLVIIGVIATLVIPTVYGNYRKQQIVTKLKKMYSTTAQAIKLAEKDYGYVTQWDYEKSTLEWFNTYLEPYMNYMKVRENGSFIYVYMTDGTQIGLLNQAGDVFCFFYLEPDKTPTYGKDAFVYFIGRSYATENKEIAPYDAGLSTIADRNSWISNSASGCSTSQSSNKYHCAGLIMSDNWEIKNDYPFYN